MKSKSFVTQSKTLVSNLLTSKDVNVLNHLRSQDSKEESIVCQYNEGRYSLKISHGADQLYVSIFGKGNCNIEGFSEFLNTNLSPTDSTVDELTTVGNCNHADPTF